MDWHGERRYAVYENFQLANEQVRNGKSGDLLVLSARVGHPHVQHQTWVSGLSLQFCKTSLLWFPAIPGLADWQTALGAGGCKPGASSS